MATDHYIDNLNRIRVLAETIKVLDLLNPKPETISLLTEMVDRAQRIPELEMMDFEVDVNVDNIEAEA